MIFLMLLPTLGAVVPVDAEASNSEEGWWVDTTVDRNQNGIGDMIERHIDNPILLKDGTLPIIVDFDHTPDENDVIMLEQQVDYEHQFYLPAIDAVAGRVPVALLDKATSLPGVVMLELDGIMTIQNGDAVALHGVEVLRRLRGQPLQVVVEEPLERLHRHATVSLLDLLRELLQDPETHLRLQRLPHQPLPLLPKQQPSQ